MENRTARINMKVRPSWKAAAETRVEDLEEAMKEKRYVFEEYRDKWGAGSEKVFENKEAAVEFAKEEWESLTKKDKDSYQQDPAGMFRVYEIEITPQELEAYEEGELDGVLDEYETSGIWDAL